MNENLKTGHSFSENAHIHLSNEKKNQNIVFFPIHVANPCAQKREHVKWESPKWHNHFLSGKFNFDRLFLSETEFFFSTLWYI